MKQIDSDPLAQKVDEWWFFVYYWPCVFKINKPTFVIKICDEKVR